MDPVIDATPGGEKANCLVSIEQAEAYWNSQLVPGVLQWSAFPLLDRIKALLQASNWINSIQRLKGQKAWFKQALEWPRTGQTEPFTEVPPEVRFATCEQAMFLLQNVASQGRSRTAVLQSQGVTSFRVGDHSQEFAPGTQRAALQHLCPEAKRLLQVWVSFTGRVVL